MEYQEYPRWIYTQDGSFVVDSKDEHDKHPGASLTPIVEGEAVEVDLVALAESKGIKVDKRWSTARLQSEIEKA